MDKKYDVVSAGGVVADILVRPVEPDVFEKDTGTRVDNLSFMPGGDAQNVSITLSQLGFKVALSGMVGDDAFGRMIMSHTSGKGVDISHVHVSKDLQTNITVALVRADGQRHFLSKKSCGENYGKEHIDLALLDETRIFSIGSMFTLKTFDGKEAAEVLKAARERGVITSSDTGGDRYGIGFDAIKCCLPYLDYFIPSEYEIRALTGEHDIEKNCDILLGLGVKNVIIKLGRDGCFIKNSEIAKRCPTFDVAPLDTTGSGDNFVAGFLSGVLEGMSFEECAMRGNACGSLNATKLGATGAVESVEQVLKFMKDTPLLD